MNLKSILSLGGGKLTVLFIICHTMAWSQSDSIKNLQEVIVHGYEYNRSNLEVPASISVLDHKDLDRYSNTSLVSAINNVPGVRMEERSPGSYRFSIRGSTLRSPFGVRNVKIYWNGLPFTDAGGNTYINQLESSTIGSVEIIRGPGSSLYGAGTGGVILLRGVDAGEDERDVKLSLSTGSFGLLKYDILVNSGSEVSRHSLYYTHQHSDGYRQHSELNRNTWGWNGNFLLSDNQRIDATVFYSHLQYETPGGLTEAQLKDDPRQARSGADTKQAAVNLHSVYAGVSDHLTIEDHLEMTTGVYVNGVKFENPSFLNLEHRTELHTGTRSVLRFQKGKLTLNGGGELQYSYVPSRTYENLNGKNGALLQDDELESSFAMGFVQGELRIPAGFNLTAGLSVNHQAYGFLRLSDPDPSPQAVQYDLVVAPRIALQREIAKNTNVFVSYANGFSPPSYAEVYPSEGTFNSALKPERGKNLEVGVKSSLFQGHLYTEISVYRFRLNQTIVIRHDDDESEYFVNAGKTKQNGMELLVRWQSAATKPWLKIGATYTLNDYHFNHYVKDTEDLSGNKLTGVPGSVVGVTADVLKSGFFLNLSATHTSTLPLNDANSVNADAFTLLSAKTGYRFGKNEILEISVGGDNLLDEVYSLGHDLNAFGGRYYNIAPGRSFYLNVVFHLSKKDILQ